VGASDAVRARAGLLSRDGLGLMPVHQGWKSAPSIAVIGIAYGSPGCAQKVPAPGDLVAFHGDRRHSYANPSGKTAIGQSVVVLAR